MPAQISLLSLLIHSNEHRRDLMKILNEAHVPDKISVNHLEKIANKIFEVNRVTFSDDELPVEDSVVTKVLVDNGSSAYICPLSTLNKLKVDDDRIHKNNICIRGFDSGGKDSVGDIVLELTIGPVEFTMVFQVLDIAVSYNLLLGQPWIHATKSVPSTLHQMVKFEWDRQEIIVHVEDNLCAHSDASVPFIEVEDEKGPWVYQVFETVSVEKVPERKCIPTSKITSALGMVAFEMLKNGFVPGKGLGVSLQGIIQPASLPENLVTFGFGFKPTVANVRRARRLKQKVWALPKPVPRLYRSFVKPGAKKRPVTTVPCSVVDIGEELIERFQRLYDDVNIMEVGEGSRKADVQFVGPNAKLNIWKVTPLPTQKKSCSFYAECDDESEYDEDEAFKEISKELNHFEETPKSNLNETEAINLGDSDNVRETEISVHLEPQIREKIIKALFEYNDIFAWSYDDMPSLGTDLVVHKLPIDPAFPPIKQKLRKFKTDMSVKIKEEVTKQLDAKVIRVTQYPMWLANVVPVPKKDGKTRVVMPFGLKNVGATYMRAMETIFHVMIHKDIEVYVDDVIIKSKKQSDHIKDLRKFFQRLRRYNLKLNLVKCAFGVPLGKLLGFIVSRRGIELDPSKIKAIQEFPSPRNKTEVMNDNESLSLADHLAENLVDEEYEPLKTYFPDEEVRNIDEVEKEEKPGWKLFFDGAANMKGVEIGAMLISETGHHYPITAQL
ncbi:uncharacterized protein [Nicotiana sylvestris]|uniref:uncharacterized protein n=1 Tax=Nicotiana sylvestris TaxID=4096 RepID=UPI00388CD845